MRSAASRRPAPKELQHFLEPFPREVGRVFLAARRLVLVAAPDATELVYDASNAVSVAFSFSGRLKEAFVHVAAYPAHVNLGFNHGAELTDPSHLLRGSGVRIRHIRLAAESDLRAPPVKVLVEAAVQQGHELAEDAPPAKASTRIRPTAGPKRRPKARR